MTDAQPSPFAVEASEAINQYVADAHLRRHEDLQRVLDEMPRWRIDAKPADPMSEFHIIDTAEYRQLRADAAEANKLRAELILTQDKHSKLAGAYDLLKERFDSRWIQIEDLETQIRQLRASAARADVQMAESSDALELAVAALKRIRDQDWPEGHVTAYGLYGAIDYLSEIAKAGLGEKSKVDLTITEEVDVEE